MLFPDEILLHWMTQQTAGQEFILGAPERRRCFICLCHFILSYASVSSESASGVRYVIYVGAKVYMCRCNRWKLQYSFTPHRVTSARLDVKLHCYLSSDIISIEGRKNHSRRWRLILQCWRGKILLYQDAILMVTWSRPCRWDGFWRQ